MKLHLFACFVAGLHTDAFLVGNRSTGRRNGSCAKGLSGSSVNEVPVDTTILEVCLSPGCLADGAQATLQKLQALSNGKNIKVQKGVCCSLCGNGPVVLNRNQKIRKVSSNDKILKLLPDDDNENGRFQNILKSFELIEQAQTSVKSRNFAQGAELFQQGVDLGISQFANGSFSLAQVSYLVDALQGQTLALLQVPGSGSKASAVDSAQRSVDLIRHSGDPIEENEEAMLSYYSSLECLQEALESCNKGVPKIDSNILSKELLVLRELMQLAEPSGLSSTQKNKRRSLGFRLQKLEKEVG